MQIHELNNFDGTLGDSSYVAVDNGQDTGKVSTNKLLKSVNARIDNIIAGAAPSEQEIIDARQGDNGLRADAHNAGEGYENIGVLYDFVNGSLINGVLNTGFKYRVATDEIISFDEDTTLQIENGFFFNLFFFVNGNYSVSTGWLSGAKVLAGETFKLIIRRENEDVSEIANVEEFVNAVTY